MPGMFIRLVIGASRAAGAVAHSAALATRVAGGGHRVELWVPQDSLVPEPLPGVDVRRWHRPVGRDGAGAVDALRRALGQSDPGAIHHGQDSVAGAAGLALRRSGRGGPVVHTVHHLEAHTDHADDEMQRATVQDADACICVTAAWARRIAQTMGVAAVVIPNGVDAESIAAAAPDRERAGRQMGWGGRPAILTLGGLSRRKGSRIALEAFGRVRARLGGDALLAVAGADEPGQERGWCEDAARLGLTVAGPEGAATAQVVRLGVVDPARVPVMFAASDLLAYPSTREGSALAVLEAASAGTAAVVSDLEAVREQVTHGRHCVMVPPGDAAALAVAMVELMNDADRRAKLAYSALQVARGLRWETAAAAHERLYLRVASG